MRIAGPSRRKPDFAEAHSNLGNALHALKRFDEAIAAYRRALELKPNYADAWANLGTTLHHNGEFDEGVIALRHAIALAPDHANAHSGLGILLLMRGDFGEGWDEYEWRLRSSERKGPRFPGKAVAGRKPRRQAHLRAGRAGIRRHAAIRALHPAARRACQESDSARASAAGDAAARKSAGQSRSWATAAIPSPIRATPCCSACRACSRHGSKRSRRRCPICARRRMRCSAGSQQLGTMSGFKVGLVWAGNPEHVNDHRRSVDLAQLAPVLAAPGVSFASLQVGPRADDLKKLKGSKTDVDDIASALNDFVESAAAVSALDLVITVDTSMAHLAGALGKPVWVLLPVGHRLALDAPA